MLGLFFLAIGLAMDAVAVSLVRGATGEHRWIRALEVGLAFGVAQGVMPLLGWGLGAAFSDRIAAFDHWIAFLLLGFLGIRMLREAASDKGPSTVRARNYYAGLAIAAIATSIDAAAAGITLPMLGQPIGTACAVIGGVTAALCVAAYWLGLRASPRSGKIAEIIGGLVLIGLGTRILVEHVFG